MIAEVYPIKRMPRKFKVFDYIIPDDMKITRGSYVLIPFRNKQLFGVVAKTKLERPRGIKLKTILSKIDLDLNEEELVFFESLAFDLSQSIPSILHSCLPTPPKRTSTPPVTGEVPTTLTIPSSEAPTVSRLVEQLHGRSNAFIQSPDLRRTTAIIAGFLHGDEQEIAQIICPNVRDAKLIHSYLGHLNPLLVTGKESNNERWNIWKQFREGKSNILVGTRISIFYLNPKITSVFLVRSSDQNHKNARNPRFNTRNIALRLHEQFVSKYFFFDVSPRVDDLHLFDPINRLSFPDMTEVSVVGINREANASPHPAICATTLKTIEQTIESKNSVLCIYNRKGHSRQLSCDDCKRVFECEKCSNILVVYEHSLRCHKCDFLRPMPMDCPHCHSTNLRRTGFGNQALKEGFEKLIPGVSIQIIDGENQTGPKGADIYIVTNFYLENIFSSFKPDKFGLVVLLDADTPLYSPSFRATEEAVRNMSEWRSLARISKSPFLTQTNLPDLFQNFVNNPNQVFESELNARIQYNQPPARRWFKLWFHSDEKHEVDHAMASIQGNIQKLVTNAIINTSTNEQNQRILEVGIDHQDEQKILTLFSTLEDRYVIDTNAFL